MCLYVLPFFQPSAWWRFVPSTVAILLCGAIVLGRSAPSFFGLRLGLRASLQSGALLAAAMAGAHFVLSTYVATYLEFSPELSALNVVHQFFQVLNDEMVMRAALITVVLSLWPAPKAVIPLLAGVFALGHSLFYGLGGVAIHTPALLTLFAFGVIANTLFVAFGHIWYGFALHYAWNIYRFNAAYYVDGRRLLEGETFNYIEGNAWVTCASLALMTIVLGVYARWGRRS
ncbi:MAG: CPBP family glutamic-type intramembrane protease [Myxococcota bacterium]